MLFGVKDEDWKDIPDRIRDIARAYSGDASIRKDPERGWVAVAEDGHVLETMWGLDPDVWARDVPVHIKEIVTERGGDTTIRHSDERGWIVYAEDHTTLFAERGDPEYREAVLIEKWWLAELLSPDMTGARRDLVTVLLGGKSPSDEAFGPRGDAVELRSDEDRAFTRRGLDDLEKWLLWAPEWFRRHGIPIVAAWRARIERKCASVDAENLRKAPYLAIRFQWTMYRYFRARAENNLGPSMMVCGEEISRRDVVERGLSADRYAVYGGICSSEAMASFAAVNELGKNMATFSREQEMAELALAGFRALRKARTAKRAASAMEK